MLDIFKKMFGGKHEKDVKAIMPLVAEINRYAESCQCCPMMNCAPKQMNFAAG